MELASYIQIYYPFILAIIEIKTKPFQPKNHWYGELLFHRTRGTGA